MQVFASFTRAVKGAGQGVAFVRRHGRPIVELVAGFVRRYGRLAALLLAAALLAAPLVRGADVGALALNALCIGMVALALRRLLRWRPRRTSRR